MQAHAALPGDARSVGAARRFVADNLATWGVTADEIDTAALLVSELASNALLHARSTIDVTVSHRSDVIRVAVGDTSHLAPVQRPHSLGATTGRGILLVDSLASTWGVERRPTGKIVWFELAPGRGDAELDAWLALAGEPA